MVIDVPRGIPVSKNRPYWRAPMGKGVPQAFLGYQSRYGDGHPNRRRCVAMARSGERCRKDALQGATCCQVHGGHKDAYRNAPEGFVSLRSGIAGTRKALAKLSTLERYPESMSYSLSPVERGKAIETARNRKLGLTT